MAELSGAESVLRKITELGEQIDSFYETVDLAKQLKDRLQQSHQIALDYDKQFGTRTAEIEELKSGFEKAFALVTELIERSDAETGRILTALGYEKSRIAGTMEELESERKNLHEQQQQMEVSVADSIREMGSGMARLMEEQQSALGENRLLLVQFLDENRQIQEKGFQSLEERAQQRQEEILYLGERTEQLQQDTEKRLYKELHSFEHLKNTYEKALNTLSEIGSRYENERAGLLDEFRNQEKAVQNSLADLAEKKRIFREDRLILEREKATVLKDMTAQMAWLSEQAAADRQQMHLCTAEHLDENKRRFLEEKDRLSLFQSEVREEILFLEEALEDFEKRTESRLNHRIREFDALGPEYQKVIRQLLWLGSRFDTERARMLTDSAFETERLQQFRERMAGDYLEIRSRHQQLRQNSDDILRNLTSRMAYFTRSAEQTIQNIHLLAAQSLDENRNILSAEQENLNRLSLEIMEEMRHQEEELEKYKNRKSFELSFMVHELGRHTDRFRKKTAAELRKSFSREQEKFQSRAEKEFRQLTRGFAQEKEGIDNALSFLDSEKQEIDRHLALMLQIWGQWGDFREEAAGTVTRMETLLKKSDADMLEILSTFAYEEAQLQTRIRELEKEKSGIRDFQKHMEKNAAETRQEITTQMARFSEGLRQDFQELSIRNTQERHENRQTVQTQSEHLCRFSERIQEEVWHLSDELERFKRESLEHIHRRYRELGRQHEQYRQSVTDEFRNSFSKETERFRNRAEADRKESILALEQEKERVNHALAFLDSGRESFARYTEQIRRICEKSDDFENRSRKTLGRLTEIGDRAEDELLRIVTEAVREKEGVRQVLETFAHERGELRKYHQNLGKEVTETAQKMAEHILTFENRGEELLRDVRLRAEQDTDELKADVQKEWENIRVSAGQTLEETAHLQEELSGFQHRLRSDTEQKIRSLTDRQKEFCESVRKDTTSLFSREREKTEKLLNSEQQQIRKALAELLDGKKIIRQEQEDAAQKLENMDGEMKNTAASVRDFTEKQIKDVSGKLEEGLREIRENQEYLHTFSGQMKDSLLQEKEKQQTQQLSFQKKITAALVKKLSEEISRLQEGDKVNLQKSMAKTDQLQEIIRKEMKEQEKRLETRMGEGFEQSRAQNETQFSQTQQNLKNMGEKQEEQMGDMADISERLRVMEEELAFMKQKKGLAALFAKEKK